MTRRILSALFVIVLFGGSVALACDGDRVVRFGSILVDRCIHRNVTLGFDHGNRREFVTLSNDDARKLYEALRVHYGKEGDQ